MPTSKSKATIKFIPCANKIPPTKLIGEVDGANMYIWYITENEYLRLNELFKRDFQETGVAFTRLFGLPGPCDGCGKYTEFIDWIWTALHRGVHSAEFMFNALKDGRAGEESMHDVYCSECGAAVAYSRDNIEGGAPNIRLAGRLNRSDLAGNLVKKSGGKKHDDQEQIRWGKWWLDDTGSTAAYLATKREEKAHAPM